MQKLTKTEEEIMLLLWSAGRATVSDLLQHWEVPKPPHSTVSSVVRILEKKGFVGHKAYGKTHEYFPLIAKEAYAQHSLADVVKGYFDGSAQRLVSHLLEHKQLDESEIADLLKGLDALDD